MGGQICECEKRERNEGGSTDNECEYNGGDSNNEYGSHVLDEELLHVDE
jgi:hypothetical protein